MLCGAIAPGTTWVAAGANSRTCEPDGGGRRRAPVSGAGALVPNAVATGGSAWARSAGFAAVALVCASATPTRELQAEADTGAPGNRTLAARARAAALRAVRPRARSGIEHCGEQTSPPMLAKISRTERNGRSTLGVLPSYSHASARHSTHGANSDRAAGAASQLLGKGHG